MCYCIMKKFPGRRFTYDYREFGTGELYLVFFLSFVCAVLLHVYLSLSFLQYFLYNILFNSRRTER